ncbi:hypothetical protein CAXC1_210009 [Candidatus Xenohaliotis californiensis]|uniref:Tetratricopeptide repeat protein n=1 Tax=Candidatus Xenohaliotis californiensis TaxID=84677 RepID=A0ABM9N7R4_9RICK|nr:hypothetical protein CAXC1_210009 [Candidatus Xenohaliotis californiensis]
MKKKIRIVIFLLIIVYIITAGNAIFLHNSKHIAKNDSIAGNYLAGYFATNNMMYSDAINYLQKIEYAVDGNIEVLKKIFYSAIIEGNMQLAKEYAVKITKIGLVDGIDKVKIFLAFDYLKNKFFREANKLFQDIDTNSNSIISCFIANMGLAWGEVVFNNNYKRGIEIIENKIGSISNDADLSFMIYNKAMIYDYSGQNDIANELYTNLIERPLPERVLEVALSFFMRNDNKVMADVVIDKMFAKGIKYNKKQSFTNIDLALAVHEILLDFGTILQMHNMSFDAIILLATAQNIYEDDRILFTLANIMHINGMHSYSNKLYAKITSNSQYYINALINTAYNNYSSGDKLHGFSLLKDALNKDGLNFDLHVAIGDMYNSDQDYDQAIKHYTIAIDNHSIEKDLWSVFFARALCFDLINQWEMAKLDLLQSVNLSNSNPIVLNYLAYSMIKRDEDVNDAVIMLEKALVESNSNPHIMDSLGWAYYKNGNCNKALILLEVSAALLPYDPIVNDHLGDVYWYSDRKREAMFQWNKVLALDPEQKIIDIITNKIKNGM